VTEIVTGGSLKSYIKKISYPRAKVIKHWCKEILKGLEYLHTQEPYPIIHRDIKSENIYINSNKAELRIGDLGLSTLMNNTCNYSILGTPEYMAPEIFDEKYNILVDIYAFGMTILEIATLETPYNECKNNPVKLYKKVRFLVFEKL
jgi:WNK lysine deficient protein kinase